jgi:hypothetical protein
VKYLDAGHVSAYVLHQKLFRSSIVEAFERSKKKWLAEKEREKNPNKMIEYEINHNNQITLVSK